MTAPTDRPLQQQENMKWYTFVVFFQLWLTLISGLFNGLSMLFGWGYNGAADLVYETFPGLAYIDRSYGMILLFWGIFAVYVRKRLKDFYADGPRLYLILLAINPLSALVYNAIAGLIVGGLDVSSLIGSLLGHGVVIWCNVVYFRKRGHLFVN